MSACGWERVGMCGQGGGECARGGGECARGRGRGRAQAREGMCRRGRGRTCAGCNGHYNRMPDLGKYVMWWNTWDLARQSILDAKVLDRNITWLIKHKDTS